MWIGILFKLFGVSFSAARLSAMISTLIAFYFLYTEILRRDNKTVAHTMLLILLLTVPFIKKARFPLLDVPLNLFTTLALIYYYKAYQSPSWKNWLFVGFFWGGALLSKGASALMIPAIIFVHLVACEGRDQFLLLDLKVLCQKRRLLKYVKPQRLTILFPILSKIKQSPSLKK